MTFREALVEAVEFVRSRADPEDQRVLGAARLLERKADRIRVSQEKRGLAPARCHCGEEKRPDQSLCPACWSLIPTRLLFERHFARGRQHRAIQRQIREICLLRIRREAEAAA